MIILNIYEKELIAEDKAISDGVKFDTVKFVFPKNWENYKKTAVFKSESGLCVNIVLEPENSLCLSENECYIPHEMLKGSYFYVSVFGVLGDSIATTTEEKIMVLKSGYSKGSAPKDPTPSEYQQLVDLTEITKQIAASVRADADSGVFNGKKGDKGEKGDVGPQGPQGPKGEKGDKGADGKTVEVDQIFDENSENPQSGRAVALGLKNNIITPNMLSFKKRTNQLFDIENPNIVKGYFNGATLVAGDYVTNLLIYVPCDGGGKYTVSRKQITSRFNVYSSVDEPKTAGVQHNGYVLGTANDYSLTINAGTGAKYISVQCYNLSIDSAIDLEEFLAGIKIEKGSAATEGNEYWQPDIKFENLDPNTRGMLSRASKIYYEVHDDEISVVSKYNETQDICVQLKKKGGNNLFDYYLFSKIPNSSFEVGNKIFGTEVLKTQTDWHSPFRIKAISNIDGDNPESHYLTGGSHEYTNTGSGGTPTARTVDIAFYADNRKISSGSGYCGKIKIIWTNMVQAYNTTKANGSGREVLKEIHELSFDGYEWISHIELIPLEDIEVESWYGLQCSFGDLYNGKMKYIGGLNRESIDISTKVYSKSGNRFASGLIAQKNTDRMVMELDVNYDLGDRSMYDGDEGLWTNSGALKGYTYLINNSLLKVNSSYFAKGKYIFESL